MHCRWGRPEDDVNDYSNADNWCIMILCIDVNLCERGKDLTGCHGARVFPVENKFINSMVLWRRTITDRQKVFLYVVGSKNRFTFWGDLMNVHSWLQKPSEWTWQAGCVRSAGSTIGRHHLPMLIYYDWDYDNYDCDDGNYNLMMIMMIVMTIMMIVMAVITVGCHLSKEDFELRLQKGLRFKLRESQRLVMQIAMMTLSSELSESWTWWRCMR